MGSQFFSPANSFCRGLLIFFFFLLTSQTTFAEIRFEEVTAGSGILYKGESWGSSWADVNRDGYPDLWVNNHYAPDNLYINNGDGTFTDRIHELLVPDIFANTPNVDTHASVWADFNNDGYPDLLKAVGAVDGTSSAKSNLFLVNVQGTLFEQAAEWNLVDKLGRGRSSLWFDWDGDGLLDVLLLDLKRPDEAAKSVLMHRTADTFVDVSEEAGIHIGRSRFAMLSDLRPGRGPEIITEGVSFPKRVYSVGDIPFQDLTGEIGLPQNRMVTDAAIADFNGDLLPDIFLVLAEKDQSDALQSADNKVEGYLSVEGGEEGVTFKTAGETSFSLFRRNNPRRSISPGDVFIGASGFHPETLDFTLSPKDAAVAGILKPASRKGFGVYIGYFPDSRVWKLVLSSQKKWDIKFIVTSSDFISGLETINFEPFVPRLTGKLLINRNGSFVDRTEAFGLSVPMQARSVVAGDFDNDMKIDIYVVCSGPFLNLPNILFKKKGDGTFSMVEGAGGAAGSLQGRGESVTVADYDNDGFLDLFVTNGLGSTFNKGPSQLFRNAGNSNHWLEIDLEGTVSNRDGIGAQVLATAGGLTQMREQNNGVHLFAQNSQRIHFGLGINTVVDSLVVKWPSGIVQTIQKVPSDHIIRVTEAAAGGVPSTAPGYAILKPGK